MESKIKTFVENNNDNVTKLIEELNITEELRDNLKTLIEKNDEKSNASVIELIKDLNVYDLLYQHGESLLHWCASSNNLIIAEYLLKEKKLHVNIENYRGTVALYYGALKNNIEVIQLLLKYNANPAIRSGFSNNFPYDVTTDKKIKKLLRIDPSIMPAKALFTRGLPEAVDMKIKTVGSKYVYYKYRQYMHLLSNLNYFHNKHRYTISGTVIIPEAKVLANDSINVLANKCQEIYDAYLNSVELWKNNELIHKQCLNCNNKEKLKKCSKCKSVYFCNQECQLISHKYHRYDCN